MTKTKFSKRIKGDDGNYNWDAEFDLHPRGYLRICQFKEGQSNGNTIEIVLLSPVQVSSMLAFLGNQVAKDKKK